MKMKGRMMLLLTLIVAVALSAISYKGIGSKKALSVHRIEQGLDLSGGVDIVYEADQKSVTDDEMKAAISLLQGRLDWKGWTEAEVAREGDKRIRVQIPGVEDAEEAIQEIGQTAQLSFADEDGNVLLTGDMVKDATKQVGSTSKNSASQPYVALEFNKEGTERFAEATSNNIGKQIYIIMDNEVISAPTVQTAITNGQAMITGSFTAEGAEQLASLIRAGSLLAEAIRAGKKIVVYGDYDVDGVMSTSILYQTILRCGGNAVFYLPHRQKEGYGLNLKAVNQLAAEGIEVLFTCDNGIAALQEIALAKEKGMTVVVLDHHEPGFRGEGEERRDILPAADAIIDPKQRACPYPFKQMCAGGLSYYFAHHLLQIFEITDEGLERQLLTFAGIATVCDIVDLLGENRALVQMGLAEIGKTENIGLRVLIEEAGLSDKAISEYHIGFIIGPCINATGRLESGRLAVELFCTQDEKEAREKARHLVMLNAERKHLTEEAAERADIALQEGDALQDRVLVLYDAEIHESIAGIVAGRIKDKYYRPTILITGSEDGAKGSGRSIEGYHLFEALFANRDLFTRFGGHAMAAGLSLPVENIPVLRRRLNEDCTLTEEQMIPILRLEDALSFAEIDLGLAKELQTLAPFGKGNPAPLFASKGIHADRVDLIGKNKDILRLTLSEPENGIRLSAISFDGYEPLREMLKALYPAEDCDKIINSGLLPQLLDIVYSIEINSYRGRSNVQLILKDFRFVK